MVQWLKVCNVPATSAVLKTYFFLLQPLTVLMKQIRQLVHAVKQSIYLDVYARDSHGTDRIISILCCTVQSWPRQVHK